MAKAVSRETTPGRWMTDRGLVIASGEATLDLYGQITAAALEGVQEIVPADGSLLIVLAPGGRIPEGLSDILTRHSAGEEKGVSRQHQISMRFDGIDLDEVVAKTGLSGDALVDLVCSLTLKVRFLGFQPGFAYLDGLPQALKMPRLSNPRKSVPKGSVALGGGYCGIYPAAGPGGWHLIGTTETQLFNPEAEPPALLQPGDTVRLVSA